MASSTWIPACSTGSTGMVAHSIASMNSAVHSSHRIVSPRRSSWRSCASTSPIAAPQATACSVAPPSPGLSEVSPGIARCRSARAANASVNSTALPCSGKARQSSINRATSFASRRSCAASMRNCPVPSAGSSAASADAHASNDPADDSRCHSASPRVMPISRTARRQRSGRGSHPSDSGRPLR